MNLKYYLFNKCIMKGKNKVNLNKNASIKYNMIKIKGENNKIDISKNTILKKCNIIINKNENHIHIGENSILKDCLIEITGKNNNIYISSNIKAIKCKIEIIANNSNILLNEKTNFKDSSLHLFSNNGEISIGKYTTFGGVDIISEKDNNKILIGEDCMFSYNINIRNTDSHPIYDLNNQLLNEGKEVIIKNKVWIGMGSTILKGTIIENGCVIGAESLVSNSINKENCIAIGIPAKIIKEDIHWEREFNK